MGISSPKAPARANNFVWDSSVTAWIAEVQPGVGGATSTSVIAHGDAAQASAPAGNPLRTGLVTQDGLPTIIANAVMATMAGDRYGRVRVVQPKFTQATNGSTGLTSSGNTTIIAAPASGSHLRVWRIHVTNSASTNATVYWRNGSAGNFQYPMFLLQGGVVSLDLWGGWELSSATLLAIYPDATANIFWHVDYETVTD